MKPGFIATYTVLIVLAVILSITTTVVFTSIGSSQASLASLKGENSWAFLEGCAEDSLLKTRASAEFGDPIGTPVSFSRPEGICQATVVSKSGSIWTIDVTIPALPTHTPIPSVFPVDTNYIRTIRIVLDRGSGGITLISWQEI